MVSSTNKSRRVRRDGGGGALGARGNAQKMRESSAQICRQKKCARSVQIRQNENEKCREK